MSPAKEDTQLALDETQIENADLEAALDMRTSKLIARREASKAFNSAHEKVVGLIESENIVIPDDGAIRVGNYRLTKAISEPRTVEFTTEPKERIKIDFDGE